MATDMLVALRELEAVYEVSDLGESPAGLDPHMSRKQRGSMDDGYSEEA